MRTSQVLGSALGYVADRYCGEPPAAVHPVVWLGRGLERLEERTYADKKGSGVSHLIIAAGGATLVAATLQLLVGRTAATALSVAVASAGRMLGQTALSVGRQLDEGELELARESVRALVGRDPDRLTEEEIVRAVIESIAENTVDAVTATLFFAQLGGPVGVTLHRVVNTLDAMVGHRSPRYARFGWASARVDDILAYLPARLSLAAVALVRPHRAREVLITAWRDAPQHPSPNGGVIEAGFAGALGIRLGGANNYGGQTEERGVLGGGTVPRTIDIDRAVDLARDVALAFAFLPIGACILTHSHLR